MSAFQACGETAESEERASVGRVRRAILRKANGECRRAEWWTESVNPERAQYGSV